MSREFREKKLQASKQKKIQQAKDKGIEYFDICNKDAASKAIDIYFKPTPAQKIILKKWFGVVRWIYNKCLHLINENPKITLKQLRKQVINSDNYKTENIWMNEYPYDLRDEALKDLLKNISSNKTKGGKFQLKFKSLKAEYKYGCSLSVLGKHWNKKNNFYSEIFNPQKLKTSEKDKLPDKLLYTSRLKRTSTKKYKLCIPQPLKVCENQAREEERIIFLDPGCRDFVVGYDPSGKVIVFGRNDIGRIARLLHYKRKLQSKRAHPDIKARKRNRLRLAQIRIGEKIRNLVTDLHRKLSKWLCENYTKIYLPRLNFHQCKKLNKKSKAKLASLRHCEFHNLLQNKTREYQNCTLYEVNESYTSKTCSHCGEQNDNLGASKVFNCSQCTTVLDRDINAAKNIMLRYFNMRAFLV